MKKKKLQAYSVQGDENGCVVFATSGVVARREGANEIDCDFEGVASCRRAPQFDMYAPGPVPIRALVEDGWFWDCFGCNIRLHGIDGNEDHDGNELVVVFPNDRSVYCSQSCYENDMRERAERKQAENNLREEFTRRYPGCTIKGCYGYPLVDSVIFDFPGGKHGGRWDANDPDHVNIAQIELPVWATYKARKEAGEFA